MGPRGSQGGEISRPRALCSAATARRAAAACGVGEPGQGVGDLIQIPNPAQIGQGGQQMQVGLQHAQRGAHRVRFGVQRVRVANDPLQRLDRVGFQQASQMGGATPHQTGEIGRSAGDGRQGGPGDAQSIAPAVGVGGLDQGFVQAVGGGDVCDRTGGREAVGQRDGGFWMGHHIIRSSRARPAAAPAPPATPVRSRHRRLDLRPARPVRRGPRRRR
ncbi:hypothetical protein QE419_000514 [Brevundimonas vesicularis]|nr:hypothetical protein [Brevundimonas vesicularis]